MTNMHGGYDVDGQPIHISVEFVGVPTRSLQIGPLPWGSPPGIYRLPDGSLEYMETTGDGSVMPLPAWREQWHPATNPLIEQSLGERLTQRDRAMRATARDDMRHVHDEVRGTYCG